MPNVIKILRGAGTPTGKTEGEPFFSEADKQFGVVDAAGVAQELIAVRHFSALAAYVVGDHVVQGGVLYRNIAAIPVPGPWDVTDWVEIGAAGAPPAETDPLALHLTGGTMTGPIVLPADAAAALEAVPLQQLEAEITALETAAAAQGLLYLPLTAGPTKPLTGPLVLDGNAPTLPAHATDKQYVDTVDADLQAQISVLASNLIYSGSLAVQTDVGDYTPESAMADGPLPTAAAAGANKYVIVTDGGVADATGNIPAGTYAPADWLVSDGAAWNWLPIGATAATQVTAPMVLLAPDLNTWGNVQVAIEALDTTMATKHDDNSTIDAGVY